MKVTPIEPNQLLKILAMNRGIDVRIDERAVIKQDINIGNHVSIDVGVYISTQAIIGDYVHIAPYCCIIGGIDGLFIMEDFANLSAAVCIVVISDDFTKGMINPIVPAQYKYLIGKEIIMRRFSTVGANSVVLPNVEMAEGSMLGAGSLLNMSTEPWTIYAGHPARAIGKRDKTLILKAYNELGYNY